MDKAESGAEQAVMTLEAGRVQTEGAHKEAGERVHAWCEVDEACRSQHAAAAEEQLDHLDELAIR